MINPPAPDWVAFHAARSPRSLALQGVDSGVAISWAELDDRVGRIASVLVGLGIDVGDRVAIVADNDVRVFELQFACMRIGAIFTPFNWRLVPAELEVLCADADPSLIVHDVAWAELGGRLASSVGVPTLAWDASATVDYESAAAAATPVRATGERSFDDPTHILYTSGTTGLPKGAIITNGTLFWQWANAAQVSSLTGYGSKYYNPLPLFHAGGLTTLAAPIHLSGGCVAVARRFEPAQCLKWLSDPIYGVTHFNAPPVMWQGLAETDGFAEADFSGLQHAHIAGSVMPLDLFATWHAKCVEIQQLYGGTEMGPTATALPAADVTRKVGSCGLRAMHTRIRLADEQGDDVATGEPGEIWLSGPSVTPGYWRREREPEVFVGDWFRTGDAAIRDADGYYFIVDRLKDVFKSGGESVFPAEIERILMELPAIAEVAVVGVADTKWGEVGRAVVVVADGATITMDDVAGKLDGRLARYKIPKSIVVVDALPRNMLGKLDKKQLRTQYGIPSVAAPAK